MFIFTKKSKHIIGLGSIIFSVLCLFASSSSRQIGTVSFDIKDDDVFSKGSLLSMIQSEKDISVMVRNVYDSNISTVTGGDPSSTMVNTLERTLTKNNFLVRDRALFEKTFNQSGGTFDYSKMSELTDTDLILEVVDFSNVTYSTNVYLSKSQTPRTLPAPYAISKTGLKLEFKLIHVKTNEIVGTYIFYENPCNTGCFLYEYSKTDALWKGGKYGTIAPGNNERAFTVTVDDSKLELFAQDAANKLVGAIRN